MAKRRVYHTNDKDPCPSCEKKLMEAHEDIARWFRAMKPQFPNMHISWSYRGPEDQNKAFAEGKSKLKYPMSAHNFTDPSGRPCARALDIFVLSEDGVASFPKPFYTKLWDASKRDFTLIWGGNFKSLGDAGHFQLV